MCYVHTCHVRTCDEHTCDEPTCDEHKCVPTSEVHVQTCEVPFVLRGTVFAHAAASHIARWHVAHRTSHIGT